MSTDTDQTVLTGLELRLFQLYVMFGTPTGQWDIESERTQSALGEHVAYLRELESTGVMFMGGPFRAADYEWDGSGMIAVRAKSLAEARATAERDPLFTQGLRTYDVRGWQLNEGRMVLTVDLDSNKVGIA
ncbi:YciI family protein [Streptomyces sp. NPDC088725]|uniref:YciI family protein n=1 Tax=Streptomyces sp. NPDC088725 TaxID=3365873 RepID=UPI0038020A7D